MNDSAIFGMTGVSATPTAPLGLRPEPVPVSAIRRVSTDAVHGLGLGKSNDWHTPKSVFDALDCRFDLDVSAPVDGPLHVPCDGWIFADSLTTRWAGFIWMNPPFGGRNGLEPWLDKFFAHGNGIALTPDRTSAPWFHAAWRRADAALFARKTPFLLPDGSKAGSPAFGTALWASGPRAAAILHSAARKGFGVFAQTKEAAA